MAVSPAHQFGQIIGDMLEQAVEPLLHRFADQHGLYLDKKGPRPARTGRKVSWKDMFGNIHDLDYVLERDGSDKNIGTPVAFIEVAWRRYTKHSRNKAQEIQSAILPLVSTHRNTAPFTGVILAGVFTRGALDQLRSQGFSILYFPYESILSAFQTVGINADFGEQSPDVEFKQKVRAWKKLSKNQKLLPAQTLIQVRNEDVSQFVSSLERWVGRRIQLIRVLPLHGTAMELNSVEEAMAFIQNYDKNKITHPVAKYEVEVVYNNGDKIRGQFVNKEGAVEFLQAYLPPPIHPA